jgi:hypothetical protein
MNGFEFQTAKVKTNNEIVITALDPLIHPSCYENCWMPGSSPDITPRSRGALRPSYAANIPPSQSEGAGNAERPQPRVVCRKHAR